MPSTHEAARALIEARHVRPEHVRLGADVPLTGAAPDTEAAPGQAAWLSPRGVDRLAAFAGSLIVAPSEASASAAGPEVTVVRTERPRLVFSHLLASWFAPEEAWPPFEGVVPDDAEIAPTARLARGVVLGAGVAVGDDVRVGPNTCLAFCTLERGVTVGANCTLGGAGFGYSPDATGRQVPFPHIGRVRIGSGARVGDNTCIDRGTLGETVVREGARIDNHVHIAHNADIGRDAMVIAHAVVAGSARVGRGAWIAPGAIVRNGIRVGDGATVGMGAVVTRDVLDGATVLGNPARLRE